MIGDMSRVGRQPIEVQNFLTLLRFPHQRDAETRCGLLQDALGRVAFAQHHVDRAGGRHVRNERVLQRAGEFVQPIQIRRIGHRDVQLSVLAPQRHELVAHHQIDRNFVQKRVIDRGSPSCGSRFTKVRR